MALWLALVAIPPVCPAQRLSFSQFQQLARACIPEAERTDLTAMARTESNFFPWALSLNRPVAAARRHGYQSGRLLLRRQSQTKEEAVRWAHELRVSGYTVSVGLLQVNTEGASVSFEKLLDPCTNLQQGWRIFLAAYQQQVQRFGPGQAALLAALGAYNAGTARKGLTNGYVSLILRNARARR
jgi:type IV secretion system protein VirB1